MKEKREERNSGTAQKYPKAKQNATGITKKKQEEENNGRNQYLKKSSKNLIQDQQVLSCVLYLRPLPTMNVIIRHCNRADKSKNLKVDNE